MDNSEPEVIQYTSVDLSVDFYPEFLSEEEADTWLLTLSELIPIKPNQKIRNTLLFGDEGITYTTTYFGTTRNTVPIPWNELPGLEELKQRVESVTKQKYTVCAIQCYANGGVGINPHRDKEMVRGTQIAGLSIGQERTIRFNRPLYYKSTEDAYPPINIPLPSGSLYVMKGLTNQKWLHSIVKDDSLSVRYSLTFRNYK
jgi:alkylated DNA repair dioxygenase AlkB